MKRLFLLTIGILTLAVASWGQAGTSTGTEAAPRTVSASAHRGHHHHHRHGRRHHRHARSG